LPRPCALAFFTITLKGATSMSNVLVLNFSYEPLGSSASKRAVRLLFARKVEVVHAGDGVIRATSVAFPLPSIVRMLYYVRRARKRVALTKKNVLLRDDYVCAYCTARGGSDMTVDQRHPAQPRRRVGLGEPGRVLLDVQRTQGQPDAGRGTDAACAAGHGSRGTHPLSWSSGATRAPDEWGKVPRALQRRDRERVE